MGAGVGVGDVVVAPVSDDGQPFSPLVGDILTAMFTDSANTTNTLLDMYESQLREARATIQLIREQVLDLVYGPFQPTTHAIEKALYPHPERLKELVAKAKEVNR